MNKKLMAVAVAGALAAPAVAFAQVSSVQIYGRANLGFDSAEAKDAKAGSAADLKRRNRVFDSSSRVGFQGTENLGMGLKAVFKIETGVNMDNGSNTGQSGAPNAATGYLASREGWAGLAGNWGELTFGKQNVWWTNFTDQTQANYINVGLQYATGGNGAGLAAPAIRVTNDVKYTSPMFSGFKFWLNYSPTSEAATGGADTDGSIGGVSAAYLGRQFIGEFHWAQNEAAGPSPATITGTKLGLGWKYQPGAILSLILIRLEDENVGAIDRKVNSWQLNWSQMMGNWQWIAQLGASGDATGTSNTGSKGWLVAAKYHLSKRTGVYASYTKVTNEEDATYDYRGGGMGVGITGTNKGADPSIFALGIQHNF